MTPRDAYSATVESAGQVAEIRSPAWPYLWVAKPGIVGMVVVATLSGLFVAGRGLPEGWLVFWTLISVMFSTAGAAALNNYWDRDIDQIMARTRGRPIPSGAVAAGGALMFGIAASVVSLVVSALWVNAMVAALNGAAIFIYVVLYTMLTKRTTPLATFIGGVGGALPPVIGYAAVHPALDVNALVLFLIIFAWQHPHFWSLALKYVEEYRAAGVRNHPVAMGVDATKWRIALWAALMVPITFMPYFLGMAGPWYLLAAAVVGGLHVGLAAWFLLSPRKVAMSVFIFSIIQLPLLFTILLLDIR